MENNNNGQFNNKQPKGFSLDEILAEVKASKERAKIEASKKKAEEEKLRFEEQKRLRDEARIREEKERAQVENEFRVRIVNEQKARVEAEVMAKLQLEQKRRQELFEKQYAEKQKKLREEAEIRAREEAERRLKEDEEARIRIEEEIRHLAETEYRAKIEVEYRKKIEAATLKREEAVRKAREEAETRILAVTEARAKAEVMARAKREAEMRAKAEAEMHAKIEAEIRAKAQAETKARLEAAEKEEAELRAIADEEQRKLALLEKEIRENKSRKEIFEFSLENPRNDRASVSELLPTGVANSENNNSKKSDGEEGFSVNNDIIEAFSDDEDIEQQLLFVQSNSPVLPAETGSFDDGLILEEPINVFPDLKDGTYSSEKRRNKEEVPLSYEQGILIHNKQPQEEFEGVVPKNEDEKTAEVFADSEVKTADEDKEQSNEMPSVLPVSDDLVKKAEEKLGEVFESSQKTDNTAEEPVKLDESRKQLVEEKLAELKEMLEESEDIEPTPFTAEEKIIIGKEENKNKFEYEGDYSSEEENKKFKENLNALFNGEIDPIASDINKDVSSSKSLSEQILTSAYMSDDDEDDSKNDGKSKEKENSSGTKKKTVINDGVDYNFAPDPMSHEEIYEIPNIYGFEEYHRSDSRHGIFEKLKKKASNALTVTIITAIITVFIAVITFVPGLPSILNAQENFTAYTIINIFAIMGAIASSYTHLFHTYKCLLKKKISFGFPAISGLLLAFIYNVAALVLNKDGGVVELFALLPLLSITLCNLSDWLTLIRVKNNFEFMVFDGGSYVGAKITQPDVLSFAEEELNNKQVNLIGSKDCEFVDNFFESSFGDKDGVKLVNTISTVAIVGTVITFIAGLILKVGLLGSLGAAVAAYLVASPVFLGFTTAFQLIFSSKTHASFGAAVVGADSVKAFSKTNAMVIDASELFCEGTVSISGIKVFESSALDEVISYAAAATNMAHSPLSQVFLSILNEKSESLPKVESLYYRDNMGLVSTVNGKEVLIGNSDFMRSYGINTPTKEMEKKVEKDSKKIVYVAVENELAVMLAVGYGIYKNSFWRLNSVNNAGMDFVVLTPDANITQELLTRELKLRPNSVVIVPSKARIEYIKDQKTATTKAGIIHDGSFDGYVTGVTGSMRLAGNLKMLRLAQIILSAIGLILPLLTVIIGGISALSSPLVVGAYIVFLIAQIGISIFRNC